MQELCYTADGEAAEFIRITLKVRSARFNQIMGRVLDDLKEAGAAIPYLVEYLPKEMDPKEEIRRAIEEWEKRTGRTLLPRD